MIPGVLIAATVVFVGDAFLGLNPAVLGPTGLLALTVLMVLTGRLVPKTTLDDQKAETANWRTAYNQERDARSTAETQTAELLSLARATNALLVALPQIGVGEGP